MPSIEHSLLDHRALIASLAGRGTGAPTVTLNRPGRMELTLQQHRTDGTLVVLLVNYSARATIPTPNQFRRTVRC